MPEISLTFAGSTIRPTNKMRLLGFQVNPEFNIKDFLWPKLYEARRRIWLLKKLQTYSSNPELMKMVYIGSNMKTFLPVTRKSMYGAMIRHAKVTQKKAVKIISSVHPDWKGPLESFRKPLEPIVERWDRLWAKYTLGSLFRQKTADIWPVPRPPDFEKRVVIPFKPVKVTSECYEKSALPSMIKWINVKFSNDQELRSLIMGGAVLIAASNERNWSDQSFRASRNLIVLSDHDPRPENFLPMVQYLVPNLQLQNGSGSEQQEVDR